MKAEKAFNKRIDQFLKDQPESSISETIRKIKSYFPNSSHYFAFDNIGHSMGIDMIITDRTNRNYKSIEHIPALRYHTDNKLGEKPGDYELRDRESYLKLDQCYSILAKELLYRLTRIKNIDELMENRYEKTNS